MLILDGSRGEGGGQILRTALALSLVTQQPFRITNIRAGRSKPGLLRQHLTAVQAAAAVSGGTAEGAALGSRELTFHPGSVHAGDYRFAVGTAGSATLVFQTIAPALLRASQASTLLIEGGTHNPQAPPFESLNEAFLPCLRTMGFEVSAELERPGFYPAGGGRFRVKIAPASALRPLRLLERGALKSRLASALVTGIGSQIAHRELRVIGQRLGWSRSELRCEPLDESYGPGNAVLIRIQSENITEVFAGFGQRRLRAEQVGEQVACEALEYLESGAAVGPHLADQLLLPMALAGGGTFSSTSPSSHTLTQAETLRLFLGIETRIEAETDRRWRLEVGA
ncbi:MAG TPA: RNA 3'-terminal phosphate cyclase [Polyangiaceae bacterium]|nr:RNA 3'-terminal phosphate cyclase [Polyangiaceae bacterium]